MKWTINSLAGLVLTILVAACSPANTPDPEAKPDVLGNAVSQTVFVKISGMTCHSCQEAIEASLKKLPHTKIVQVSLAKQEARVTLDFPGAISLAKARQAVESRGYTVKQVLWR